MCATLRGILPRGGSVKSGAVRCSGQEVSKVVTTEPAVRPYLSGSSPNLIPYRSAIR